MGRLTEALRRAADAAGKEPRVANDTPATPAGAMNDVTDDLFPIEFADSGPQRADALAGAAAEPAGGAVIVPSTPPPVVTAPPAVEPPSAPPAATPQISVATSGNGSARQESPSVPLDEPRGIGRQTELFESLDATLAQKIVVDQNIMPVSREQYRRLAATLHHAQEDAGVKVVLVASAVVGEGKTLTASNLALTLSESYQRTVLLIDGDFRRPALHIVFNIDAPSGLSEGLIVGRGTEAAAVPRVAAVDDSAGGQAQFGPDGRPDVQPHAPRDSGSACKRSTGSSSTRRRSGCCPTRTCSRRWSTAPCSSSGPTRRRITR